jgi:hypothetical protein
MVRIQAPDLEPSIDTRQFKFDRSDRKIWDRFLSKVKYTDDCWMWVGAKIPSYGYFYIDRKVHRAHRVSYVLHKGTIPYGKLVLHTCENLLCVNPHHLVLGTHQDYVDSYPNKFQGSKNGNSKLTEFQVADIKRDLILYKHISHYVSMLAKKYKTSKQNIYSIKSERSWKSIKPSNPKD